MRQPVFTLAAHFFDLLGDTLDDSVAGSLCGVIGDSLDRAAGAPITVKPAWLSAEGGRIISSLGSSDVS